MDDQLLDTTKTKSSAATLDTLPIECHVASIGTSIRGATERPSRRSSAPVIKSGVEDFVDPVDSISHPSEAVHSGVGGVVDNIINPTCTRESVVSGPGVRGHRGQLEEDKSDMSVTMVGFNSAEGLTEYNEETKRSIGATVISHTLESDPLAQAATMGSQIPPASPKSGATRKGRWTLKYKIKCRFCGGKLCLRCSERCALRCKGAAIHGLHSSWITDSIIAMQRPSSRLMTTYDVIGQLKRKGVTAVFNLTEAGEHPFCGDGLEPSSGFPYLPETFMREERARTAHARTLEPVTFAQRYIIANDAVSFFNFAWEDMTTPPLSLLMDIVRVAVACLRNRGKIAVHCHAGYGRTGLVIASVMVMAENLTAQQAVALVREKRPLSVQTDAQVAIVGAFADFVRGVRVVYHFTDHARVTLGQHLSQQAFLLHGQESVTLRWLPKPVALATRMLTALSREKPMDVARALANVEAVSFDESRGIEAAPVWGMAQEKHLRSMQYASNGNDWGHWEQLVQRCEDEPESIDPRLPAQLLHDWLVQLAVPAITVTELRRVLPQCISSETLSDDKHENALKTSNIDVKQGAFFEINLLPVGQVRLLQCLTECLREVKNALEMEESISKGGVFQMASLRVAISLFHLDKVHDGLLIGRQIAPDVRRAIFAQEGPSTENDGLSAFRGCDSVLSDLNFYFRAIEVLVKDWKAPLRCRPYNKLEALDNQPEVHKGDEEYWHHKRRSVVPPKDLIQPLCSRSGDGRLPPCTYAHQTTVRMRHTCSLEGASLGYINSAVTLAARDDAEVPITSANSEVTTCEPLRRRSMSLGGEQGLLHLPQIDVGPLDEGCALVNKTVDG